MKVKIAYTVDVSDEFRRAVNAYSGRSGKATRQELKDHYECYGTALDDEVIWDYENRDKVDNE